MAQQFAFGQSQPGFLTLLGTLWIPAGPNGTSFYYYLILDGLIVDKIYRVIGAGSSVSQCFAEDTLLTMNPGKPRTIHDLRTGDFIYSYNERLHRLESRRITAVLPKGKQMVFEVRTRNRAVKVTDNHPFLALRIKRGKVLKHYKRFGKYWADQWLKVNRYVLEWVKTKDLKKGDIVVALRQLPNGPKRIGQDLAQFLGYYTGDGSFRITRDSTYRIVLYCASQKEAWKYGALGRKLFGVHPHYYVRHKCFLVHFNSKQMALMFRDQNYHTGNKLKRRLPNLVWTLHNDEKRAFLQGYAEADAHRLGKSWTPHTNNVQLIEEVRELAIQAGYRVDNMHSQMRDGKAFGKGPFHSFRVWHNPTGKRSTFGRTKGVSHYEGVSEKTVGLPRELQLQKIYAIKPVGEQMTWDISVDGTENFVGNGLLLHNTTGIPSPQVINPPLSFNRELDLICYNNDTIPHYAETYVGGYLRLRIPAASYYGPESYYGAMVPAAT